MTAVETIDPVTLVERAAAYARRVHAADTRKGSGLPYFDAHLEPVAAIVRRNGGDAVQIAAAYLHDTAEDHGGHARLADVRAEFGEQVAEIVADLSDSLADTEAGEVKAPWDERKRAYVASLEGKSTRSLEVAAADKLQNVGSIVEDHAVLGDAVWQRFNTQDPADHRWYYEALLAVLVRRLPGHPTVVELAGAVDALRQVTG